MSRKNELRFRRSAAGAEVFLNDHWVPADSQAKANVSIIMKQLYPRLYPPAMQSSRKAGRRPQHSTKRHQQTGAK